MPELEKELIAMFNTQKITETHVYLIAAICTSLALLNGCQESSVSLTKKNNRKIQIPIAPGDFEHLAYAMHGTQPPVEPATRSKHPDYSEITYDLRTQELRKAYATRFVRSMFNSSTKLKLVQEAGFKANYEKIHMAAEGAFDSLSLPDWLLLANHELNGKSFTPEQNREAMSLVIEKLLPPIKTELDKQIAAQLSPDQLEKIAQQTLKEFENQR